MRLSELEAKALKNKYIFFSIVYTLAHVWIVFIPNAVFWDDWVLHNTDHDKLLALFSRAGSMFNIAGHIHVFLQNHWLGWYKIGVFVFFLGAGFLLNKILERHEFLSDYWRVSLVALFLVLPLNPARVAQINFLYALCYFAFFLAWFFMDKRKNVALILYFISFNTNSVLVFYAIPVVDYVCRNALWRKERLAACWLSLLQFSLLPIIYFSIKNIYFSPSGEYSNYNSNFSFLNIENSMLSQIQDFLRFFAGYEWLLHLSILGMMLMLAVGMMALDARARKLVLALAVLGVIFTVLACIPYWIVGHVPTIKEWTSRHQLLMPLGLACVLVSMCMAFGSFVGRLAIGTIIAASIAVWVGYYQDFYSDWEKQQRLVSLFRNNEKLRDSRLIVFQDESANLNALGRSYRPYEWNGLMVLSFGDESRFGILRHELTAYCDGGYDEFFVPHYKAKDHVRFGQCSPVFVRIFDNQIDDGPGFFYRGFGGAAIEVR